MARTHITALNGFTKPTRHQQYNLYRPSLRVVEGFALVVSAVLFFVGWTPLNIMACLPRTRFTAVRKEESIECYQVRLQISNVHQCTLLVYFHQIVPSCSSSIYMNISPVAGNGGGSGGSAGHFAKPGRLKVTVLTETLKVWHHSIARLATSWKTSELPWSIYFLNMADYQKNSKGHLLLGQIAKVARAQVPELLMHAAFCDFFSIQCAAQYVWDHLGRLKNCRGPSTLLSMADYRKNSKRSPPGTQSQGGTPTGSGTPDASCFFSMCNPICLRQFWEWKT